MLPPWEMPAAQLEEALYCNLPPPTRQVTSGLSAFIICSEVLAHDC